MYVCMIYKYVYIYICLRKKISVFLVQLRQQEMIVNSFFLYYFFIFSIFFFLFL